MASLNAFRLLVATSVFKRLVSRNETGVILLMLRKEQKEAGVLSETKCPGTTFPIRVYKNGVKGISASVRLLASWKWEWELTRFRQIFKPQKKLSRLLINNVAVT
jgi:hypothetical protein